MAVIGISEDGMIAIANQTARQLFAGGGSRPLLGEMAEEVLPKELLSFMAAEKGVTGEGKKLQLADGKAMHCWRSPMGEISHSKGVVLVIDAER